MGHQPLRREAEVENQIARIRDRTDALERRYAIGGRFVGIVFNSLEPVITGDDAGAWFLAIPEDLNALKLSHAHAVVYDVSGSDTTLQIRNVTTATDMLSTEITIDSGDHASYTSGTQPDIDLANNEVSTGDIIVVDVTSGGGDALGLDVILAFD